MLFNEKESDKRDAVFRKIYDLNKYKYLLNPGIDNLDELYELLKSYS